MKLTKEQLEKTKYVSINDYLENVDKFSSLEDKMKYTTRYLLTHSLAKTYDYPLYQAIHYTRVKIASIMNNENDKDNLRANMFLADPINYLKNEAKCLYEKIEENDINLPYETQLGKYSKAFYEEDMKNDQKRLDDYSNNVSYNGFNFYMNKKIGKINTVEETLKNTNSNFLSRLFGTSSTAYKNLKASYESFNNKNNVHYGDLNIIDKAAKDYLKYKIPNWKEGNKIDENALRGFNKTEKNRIKLSLNIIESVKEQKEIEIGFKNNISNAINKNVQYEDIIASDKKELEERNYNNKNFQSKVVIDLDNETQNKNEIVEDLENNPVSLEIGNE